MSSDQTETGPRTSLSGTYRCRYCGKELSTTGTRKGHERQVHPLKHKDIPVERFKEVVDEATTITEIARELRMEYDLVRKMLLRHDLRDEVCNITAADLGGQSDLQEAIESGMETDEESWRKYSRRGGESDAE